MADVYVVDAPHWIAVELKLAVAGVNLGELNGGNLGLGKAPEHERIGAVGRDRVAHERDDRAVARAWTHNEVIGDVHHLSTRDAGAGGGIDLALDVDPDKSGGGGGSRRHGHRLAASVDDRTRGDESNAEVAGALQNDCAVRG